MKSIFSFLFVVLFFSSLQAQMSDGFRFGLKLGVNGSNVYDDANAADIKKRVGVTGGVFVQVPLGGKRLSLRPELLFTTKGAAYDYLNNKNPDIKINYLELPLSLEYHLFGVVNLHAGGYASLLASGDGDVSGVPGQLEKASFEDFDFGWHVGTGLDIGGLGLHFRISRGLKNVGNQSASALLGDLKNSAWALTLSYGF
ncbi:MAG TPA: porin family protein [Saprospiraceae bacterium]|nr:porin family protein [Saprospiraceae bacterium]